MIDWVKRLVGLLVGRDRTGIPRRYDWRGYPVDENTGNANFPVSFPQEQRPGTLYPRSSATESSTSNSTDSQSRDH
jgi:hypothetical protein